MTTQPPTSSPNRRLRRLRWLSSRRRRVVTAAAVLLVGAVIALGVTDPFSSSEPTSGVTDNSYPTGTAKVTAQTLSSQTPVSATLGFAGSYTVAVPNGTSAQAIAAAESTAQVAEVQAANAKTALKNAEATATPTNASTMLAARNTVADDETTLIQAQAQLASDENLGCPASSSSTVTSPASASSASTSNAHESSNVAEDPNASTYSDLVSAGPQPLTPATASAPSVSTGPVDNTTNTSATLTGSVTPNGAETTYYFEYGPSPNYGETTPPTDAGAGSDVVPVTVMLADLLPGDTYHYRLVATNSDGTSYGQDATFQTSAAPSAVTGQATSVSSTSESLSGTVSPYGVETTYYFEYGTSSSFGETTPVESAGGDVSPTLVSEIVSGLSTGATYDYALVASSALGTSVGVTLTFQGAASSCVSQKTVISEDSLALSQSKYALTLDELGQGAQVDATEETLVADEATVGSDEQALSSDEASATNANTTFTELPGVGSRLTRGESVYRLNNQPVPLFYGATPLYRALYLGVSDGPDVTELNENLIALGFERVATSDEFTGSTEEAVTAWQESLGEPATGVVALDDIVVEPGPLEVAAVTAAKGQLASGGMAVLTATSRTPVVTIDLDAAQQTDVKVGDAVTITLPNNANIPGVVTSVGTVAVEPPANSSSGPTITVIVTPTHLTGLAHYDQAPVNVSITNATVNNVLTVPVDSLLALASGGYAVEEISADGVHHLVGVTTGLFDDASGRVQVSGSGLAAGQRVVVPKL